MNDVTGLVAHDDMNTKEQHDYVDSIPDNLLRSHLLHLVRLRDNVSRDRDSFERQHSELVDRFIQLRTNAQALVERAYYEGHYDGHSLSEEDEHAEVRSDWLKSNSCAQAKVLGAKPPKVSDAT